MNKKYALIILLAILILSGGTLVYKYFMQKSNNLACTMEAKLCPDGSYVGRTGPNCEFAECPVQSDKTANWKTYRNDKYGYEIKYPNDWAFREYPDTQTGAGFRPENKPNEVQYEFINIDARGTAGTEYNTLFSDYVKKAGITEIQNYEKLNSIEEIITEGGIKGYKTTWIYSDMRSGEKEVSLPISYFDYQKTIGSIKYKTIQVGLGNNEYKEIYDLMLSTFKFLDGTSSLEIYKNDQYGFTLTLSKGWQGYSVITTSIEYGWKIVIRNPKWTEANPYEDIPILVYPIEQWQKWEANNFEDYPTAAPFGPLERGRNAKYVFATAPRYNYDYRTGWEDVENIIKTLKAF